MSDRMELRLSDFLIEGRDEAKSHVFLEIAKPTPEEAHSHGYFFAIAELAGATPKTIQMMRAWIEFAIQSYYATTPTSHETHFETILSQLNTQSSLYLRQHANETIHMAVAAVCNGSLYLALHGQVGALLFYRTENGWRHMSLGGEQAPERNPRLFSNVVNGTLRADDRLLIGSPHTLEFFGGDRLTKISEGKSMEEISEHMQRVLRELSSDFSFAGVWMRLERVPEPEAPPAKAPGERQKNSMAELMRKTKSTSDLLAPPVLTIPKDKIVTSVLKLSQRGITRSGEFCLHAGKSTLIFLRTRGADMLSGKFSARLNVTEALGHIKDEVHEKYTNLPRKRRYGMMIAIAFGVLTAGAISYLALSHSWSVSAEQHRQQLLVIEEKARGADDAFTYQNESSAQQLISEATALFATLPEDFQESDEAVQTKAYLMGKRNKILRISPIGAPEQLAENVRAVTAFGNQLVMLKTSGDITLGNAQLGTIAGATTLLLDDERKRLIVVTGDKTLSALTIENKATAPITVDWMTENTRLSAAVIYSGRLYVYDDAARNVFRYDSTGESSFGNGKQWITDASKPAGITQLTADTSLWMLANSGSVLKYTAGKQQQFSFGTMEPAMHAAQAIVLGARGESMYFIDRTQPRIIVTGRDGKLIRQYLLPNNLKLISGALDKTESAVIGLTDDGKVVKFTLAK